MKLHYACRHRATSKHCEQKSWFLTDMEPLHGRVIAHGGSAIVTYCDGNPTRYCLRPAVMQRLWAKSVVGWARAARR